MNRALPVALLLIVLGLYLLYERITESKESKYEPKQ